MYPLKDFSQNFKQTTLPVKECKLNKLQSYIPNLPFSTIDFNSDCIRSKINNFTQTKPMSCHVHCHGPKLFFGHLKTQTMCRLSTLFYTPDSLFWGSTVTKHENFTGRAQFHKYQNYLKKHCLVTNELQLLHLTLPAL